ncbi:MAG: hypothetical protein P4L81_02000, partial [Candidatus Pacebacteria bacterium]|nr:hypothetical protein [Candidatus Paceibacterota bacterium]
GYTGVKRQGQYESTLFALVRAPLGHTRAGRTRARQIMGGWAAHERAVHVADTPLTFHAIGVPLALHSCSGRPSFRLYMCPHDQSHLAFNALMCVLFFLSASHPEANRAVRFPSAMLEEKSSRLATAASRLAEGATGKHE